MIEEQILIVAVNDNPAFVQLFLTSPDGSDRYRWSPDLSQAVTFTESQAVEVMSHFSSLDDAGTALIKLAFPDRQRGRIAAAILQWSLTPKYSVAVDRF